MTPTRIFVGGCPVDLRELDEVIETIRDRTGSPGHPPLAVASVNLDHVHHFGSGSRWFGSLDGAGEPGSIEWLNLIDGAPIASQAGRETGRAWPRLAGSDLIGPILAAAERDGASVGFLGGDTATHELLRSRLAHDHPALRLSGFWAPSRDELGDRERSATIARDIASTDTDILVVGLGKPRQELWITEHGVATGARVLLAFGAVVDFLADRIDRAPGWVAAVGMEWAWRLAHEPKRLARRYLVDGPPAYAAVRHRGAPVTSDRPVPVSPLEPSRHHGFAPADGHADVAVVVVTFNSADHLDELLRSLRAESGGLRLRVIVADNGSTDATLARLHDEPGVIAVESGGNVGYAAGINTALRLVGDADAVLVLNPDLVVERGALRRLHERMVVSGAGVVVPQILDAHGEIYPSIRREPTITRAVGDALLGSPSAGRPAWSSEIDVDQESYRHAHRIDWATGAALLIHRDVVKSIGDWDTRFFLYSEETDFFRRVRDAGFTAWYEPDARVRHDQGGSGSSTELLSLMAVNRIRYMRKHHPAGYSSAFHAAVLLHEALRSYDPAHRATLRVLLEQRSWRRLPKASRWPVAPAADRPVASVIVPAHNEQAVIARTLSSIAPLAESGRAEVIVVCNGCTDATAEIARGFAGVRVIELAAPSKTAALNAGDEAARFWPRLYLDADIDVHPGAILAVAAQLARDGCLAARPAFRYDTVGSTALVRAYYRARSRLASTNAALWGAGAYALNERGHERFTRFPELTADDLFVDQTFTSREKRVVETEPVRVRTPRTPTALLTVLTRQSRGNSEAKSAAVASSSTRSTMRELAATVRGPLTAFDAAVYAIFTVLGRRAAGSAGPSSRWETDSSTR
ncbi:WecB/TagA/CpsF family glycosyltransferase [Lacisediminihabitans sp.]|uniref:WecB/TagA/CpsF family glycosyltransferase n=1 Tax=Lacisediminihabitans sp. TaxID=2787631 RepID=UPI00374D11C3